jgi:hypothetical protein
MRFEGQLSILKQEEPEEEEEHQKVEEEEEMNESIVSEFVSAQSGFMQSRRRPG